MARKRTDRLNVWPAFTDTKLAFVLILVLMLSYQVARSIELSGGKTRSGSRSARRRSNSGPAARLTAPSLFALLFPNLRVHRSMSDHLSVIAGEGTGAKIVDPLFIAQAAAMMEAIRQEYAR